MSYDTAIFHWCETTSILSQLNMDNRRIYKKRNDKKNLISRVKTLVGSLWQKSQSPEPIKEPEPTINTPKTNKILESTTPITINEQVEKTPNVLLSEFFQQKGDKPLSTIEYEGVLSLLSQSNRKDYVMPGTFSNSPIRSPSKSHDINHSINESFVTNTSPQTLRNESSRIFATPEYKSVYNLTSSTKKKVPSVKRVYQFSGLPSPYRTRIKPPVMTPKRLKPNMSMEKSDKPMNKAATTLLSVLDDSKKSSSYLQQFSNPYISKKNFSADVINSTLMFDKSVDIPESSNNLSVTTPADNGSVNPEPPTSSLASVVNAENNKEGKEASKFNFTFPKATEVEDTDKPETKKVETEKVETEKVETEKVEPKIEPFKDHQPVQPPQLPAESKPSIPQSSIPQPTQSSIPSNSQPKPAFNFNFNPQPETTKSPQSDNETSTPEPEPLFKFPSLKPQAVTLDSSKVENYKKLFSFV